MTKTSPENNSYLRPFWFKASNYFLLLLVIALACSLVGWFVLEEVEEEFSLVIAFGAFVLIFCVGIFARGKLKRRAQTKILIENNKLNEKFHIRKQAKVEKKLTIPINAAIISDIEKKSEAAMLLGNIPEVHWEVFANCNEYLEMIEGELKTVGIGSPRIAALVKGRERIRKIHKKHLLRWLANESGELTRKAALMPTPAEKIVGGQQALMVLESALEFYPNEKNIYDSISAVNEFIVSTQLTDCVERAEKAASDSDLSAAISLYRDALFLLASENARIDEKELIADRINNEILKLRNRKSAG